MGLRRVCTQHFRDTLLKHFPGLNIKEEYRRHMRRLIYAKDPLKIPISQLHIAFDFNVLKEYYDHEFAAIKYIEEFRGAVFPYGVIEWDWEKNQCRYAVVRFKPEITQLIEDERLGKFNNSSRRVLISNGNLVDKNTGTKFRKEDKQQALKLINHRDMHPLPLKFITYLNELPYNRFTNMRRYIPEAFNAIEDKDDKGNYIINPLAHMEQRDILNCIDEQPQPFYSRTSSNNTVRVYEINKGLQGIHSHLRRILTQDYIEVDIQNAHLAIVASLWNIPEIQDYLAKGESIWSTLIPAMGYTYPNPKVKSDLKEFFYGIIYGMGRKRLKHDMTATFGEEAYKCFVAHPLIKALKKGRSIRTKMISSKTEHLTPLGTITKPQSGFNREGKFENNISTILSQETNDIEMLLLEPIIDLAMVLLLSIRLSNNIEYY